MKRLFIIIICLFLLCGSAFATSAEEQDLELLLRNFMREKGLNEENFALSYCSYRNFQVDETYSFNADKLFPSGELWKFPMHMYFHEAELDGQYDAPADDPDYVFTIDGLTLEQCRQESIVNFNHTVSEAMRSQIGDVAQFKIAINEAFGHCYRDGQWPDEYLDDVSSFNTNFWINCLNMVQAHPEVFPRLLERYEAAEFSDGLASYGTLPMTSIYDQGEDYIGNFAVVTVPGTSEYYLVACYVSVDAGGNQILSELSTLLGDYFLGAKDEDKGTSVPGISREDALAVPFSKDSRAGAYLWIGLALGAAALIAVSIIVTVFLVRRHRHRDYYDY